MAEKDKALSREAGEASRAQKQECFINAWRALIFGFIPELQGAVYVEGVYMPSGGPFDFEHGWLETLDGRIVDPTWPETDDLYFPAVRFTVEDLQQRIDAGDITLPYFNFDPKLFAAKAEASRAAMASLIGEEKAAQLYAQLRQYNERMAAHGKETRDALDTAE